MDDRRAVEEEDERAEDLWGGVGGWWVLEGGWGSTIATRHMLLIHGGKLGICDMLPSTGTF